MIDFLFSFASSVLQMNLKDPHEIPFALPIVFSGSIGFIIGFILVRLIPKEE